MEANGARTAEGGFPDGIGWVKVTSSQPVIIRQEIQLTETISIGLAPPQTTIRARVTKFPSAASRKHWVEVRSAEVSPSFRSNTGIAIVYSPPTSSPSSRGLLVLRNFRGETVAETSIILSPNTQVVRLFTELFRSVTVNDFDGSVEMAFDEPVFLTAIQITTDRADELMTEPNSGSPEPVR